MRAGREATPRRADALGRRTNPRRPLDAFRVQLRAIPPKLASGPAAARAMHDVEIADRIDEPTIERSERALGRRREAPQARLSTSCSNLPKTGPSASRTASTTAVTVSAPAPHAVASSVAA